MTRRVLGPGRVHSKNLLRRSPKSDPKLVSGLSSKQVSNNQITNPKHRNLFFEFLNWRYLW